MIYKTHNYEIFKKHKHNWDINFCNVERKVESLMKSNNLKNHPIFVNKKMEVLDGQHRLEAAKLLNLEVYFTIKEDAGQYGEKGYEYYINNYSNEVNEQDDLKDIILLNNNQTLWDAKDYLTAFINNGNINYIKFNDFMKNNLLDIPTMMALFACTGDANRKFREGLFTFPDNIKILFIEKALFNIRKIQNILNNSNLSKDANYYKRYKFVQGLIKISKAESFSWDILINKIQENISKIHICHTIGDYANMFMDIYNYGARKHKIAL